MILVNLQLLVTIQDRRIELDIAGPIDDSEYWKECQIDCEMNSNVSVGILARDNEKVLDILSDYHCLCSTEVRTLAVIYECLSVGRPV